MQRYSDLHVADWVLRKKGMNKRVKDVERGEIVEPTHSKLVAPSLLVPKKTEFIA